MIIKSNKSSKKKPATLEQTIAAAIAKQTIVFHKAQAAALMAAAKKQAGIARRLQYQLDAKARRAKRAARQDKWAGLRAAKMAAIERAEWDRTAEEIDVVG
jgi:hypothetical protein